MAYRCAIGSFAHLLDEGASVFARNGAHSQAEQEAVETDLYEQLGRLKMELEWLKKSCPMRLMLSEAWSS